MRVDWEDALAVLSALVAPDDRTLREAGSLTLGVRRPPTQLGLDLDYRVVHDALLALGDLGYVEWSSWGYSSGPHLSIADLRVTGRGMQALGQWPALLTVTTPATLSHLLDALSPYAADPVKQGVLREAAEEAKRLAGPTLRRAVVSGSSAYVRHKLGWR